MWYTYSYGAYSYGPYLRVVQHRQHLVRLDAVVVVDVERAEDFDVGAAGLLQELWINDVAHRSYYCGSTMLATVNSTPDGTTSVERPISLWPM